MSNVTRLPPHPKTIHVEADIPVSQDTGLANACLDYLNYDRLGIKEVHKHLSNGEEDLHRWLQEYGIEPVLKRR